MLTVLLSILLSIYRPPVAYEISLAGNFGEPRPHHFHGGLDIKTDGVEGKPIYSIGDGYVSRVTCGKYGFGNAVYVTHPEGYTSVYCHLRSFTPRIKAALRRYQYTHQTSEADATFSPLECPVSQGQLIALSGNTGHSTGPHLHLEIHDTETGDMLDPLEFIGDFINDTVPPVIHGLMAYPQAGEGVFNGKAGKQTFSSRGARFTAWGKVGFGVRADDYMQDAPHHYGIRETVFLVDGEEYFRAVVNRIPSESNRFVNSWGDYDYWNHRRTWYMKSFIEPGNSLSILQAPEHRGIVDFSEERDYQLEYILRDYKGNETRCTFTVRGEKSKISGRQADTTQPSDAQGKSFLISRTFRWNQTNAYACPGVQLIVPYGLLAADIIVRPELEECSEALSDRYRFTPSSCPLLTDGEISIYARAENLGADDVVREEIDPSKFYVSANGKYAGGIYERGWVTGQIRDLGATFELAYDDTPPTIEPVSLGERIALRLSDKQSGVASYTATIDGRFVVFDSMDKSPLVVCQLDETPIKKTGKAHRLVFSATDYRDNTKTYETDIIY